MPRSAAEQARLDRFGWEYRNSQHGLMLEIERKVCGCDYGGTSWTTRQEADRVAGLLGLGPGKRMLDLGAGAGWPGIYLARMTGAEVALADVPVDGIRLAAGRARAEGLSPRCWAVVADGAALPFDSRSFDAIGHSDVLCCLEAKLAVLAECRRVVHDGGRMAFTVISIAPELSPADHARAAASGPPFKAVTRDYPPMLEDERWRIAQYTDVTAEYAATVRHMLAAEETRAAELSCVLGEREITERLARRRNTAEALAAGLLRRELYVVDAAG